MDPFDGSKMLKGIPKGVVYHYTNIDNFWKIINSKNFWLSNYTDLKGDNEEMVWPFDVFNSSIKHIFPKNLSFEKVKPETCYVLCTCIREDNEHLWKEYSGNFTGVAIGIDIENLYHYYHYQHGIQMSPLEYDENKFINLCHEKMSGLNPVDFGSTCSFPPDIKDQSFETKKEYLYKNPEYNKFVIARDPIFKTIGMQKRERFKLEEEVRIIYCPEWADNKPLLEINTYNKVILPL